MVDYRIVKWCSICKKRFVVNKGESKRIYCDECQAKMTREAEASEEVQ